MTTIHIISDRASEKLIKVTKIDALRISTDFKFNIVYREDTVNATLQRLANTKFAVGDIICIAGTVLRPITFEWAKLAIKNKTNYCPGSAIDHRGLPIGTNKIKHRLPLEQNNHNSWPYISIIGDLKKASTGFTLLQELDLALAFPFYSQDIQSLETLLCVLPSLGLWEAPNWFKIVDLSIRDLEIQYTMYNTHTWHDWIAFYPANGNFKLENHSQLYPLWLDSSEKPLEYWENVRN